jgi:hypothetical protein
MSSSMFPEPLLSSVDVASNSVSRSSKLVVTTSILAFLEESSFIEILTLVGLLFSQLKKQVSMSRQKQANLKQGIMAMSL